MSTKYDISNSMVQELIQYQSLVLKVRATTGNPTFTSSSSSQTYTVSDNGGETSLMGLLKTALENYMITSADWNNLYTDLNSAITTMNNIVEFRKRTTYQIAQGGWRF